MLKGSTNRIILNRPSTTEDLKTHFVIPKLEGIKKNHMFPKICHLAMAIDKIKAMKKLEECMVE